MRIIIAAIISLIIIIGCAKEEQKTNTDMLKDPHGMAEGDTFLKVDSSIFEVSDFILKVPAGWFKEEPMSSMRICQFGVKSDSDAKVVGFYFGNQPDMADANIDRWKQEFTKVDNYEKSNLVGDKITFIRINGTYKKKPFPMAQEFTETEGYTTLAAIIPSSKGPYYFKFVAPNNIANSELENFKKFLNSYTKK